MNEPYRQYMLESGKILEIHVDESPESPREWDNLGIVACSHRRYSLSDKDAPKIDPESTGCKNWSDVEDYLIREHDARVILPIYMYDHSGITLSTTPFSCGWDSGQVGFIYATNEKLKKEYNVKRIGKKILERAKKVLEGEIETYDTYVKGEVYGFKLMQVDIETNERKEVDSCWGFYTDDIKQNGMLDCVNDDCNIMKEL